MVSSFADEYGGTEGDTGTSTGSASVSHYQGLMGQGLRFYVVDPDGNVVSSVFDIISSRSLTSGTPQSLSSIPAGNWFTGTKLGQPITQNLIDNYYYLEIYDDLMWNLGVTTAPTYRNSGSSTFQVCGDGIRTAFTNTLPITINGKEYDVYALGARIINEYNGSGEPYIYMEGLDYSKQESVNTPHIQKNDYTVHVETILWTKINYTNTVLGVDWAYGTVTEIGQFYVNKGYTTDNLAAATAITTHTFALTLDGTVHYNNATIATVSQPKYVSLSTMGNNRLGHAMHWWNPDDWGVPEVPPLTSSTYIDTEYRSSSTTPEGNPVTTPDISPHPVSDKIYIDPDPTNSVNYTTEEAEEIYYPDITDKTTASGDTTIVKMYFSITEDKFLDTVHLSASDIHHGGGLFSGESLSRMKLDEIYVRADATSNIKVEPEPETGYTLMAYLYFNTLDGAEP